MQLRLGLRHRAEQWQWSHQRTTLNFIPSGVSTGPLVSCADNGGSTKTDCTVSAVTGSGANQRVAVWNAAGTINSDANLLYDGTTFTVGGGTDGARGVTLNYNTVGLSNTAASTAGLRADASGNPYWVKPTGSAQPLFRTDSSAINLLAPAAGDSGKIGFEIPQNATITRVYCATDTGTLQGLQLAKRTEPAFTGGTSALTAADCTPTGVSYTITSSAVTAQQFLAPTWTGVLNTPTALPTAVHIVVEYTIP